MCAGGLGGARPLLRGAAGRQDLFVFRFGAVVFWGFAAKERSMTIASLLQEFALRPLEQDRPPGDRGKDLGLRALGCLRSPVETPIRGVGRWCWGLAGQVVSSRRRPEPPNGALCLRPPGGVVQDEPRSSGVSRAPVKGPHCVGEGRGLGQMAKFAVRETPLECQRLVWRMLRGAGQRNSARAACSPQARDASRQQSER